MWSVRPSWSAPSGRRGLSRLLALLKELDIEVDVQLFELALRHRSYAYEAGGIASNERLEFLGDAVLEIVVTDHIYRAFPELAEGELAKLRASVVSAVSLAKIARSLELGPMIMLGKGEIATKGADKKSILADTMEAVIGAIYLSSELAGAARFIHHIFDPLIVDSFARGDYADHKTTIQELSARYGWQVSYQVEGSGPDHAREYHAVVLIDGVVRGSGVAPNKRRAEQIAAQQAVAGLKDA